MRIPMDPQSIAARLDEVARLTDLRTENRLNAKIDYSPAAIARRLSQVAELRRLCLTLGQATPKE